jgi:transketolase
VISVERYGASAPGSRVFEEYWFTVEHVFEEALRLLKEVD